MSFVCSVFSAASERSLGSPGRSDCPTGDLQAVLHRRPARRRFSVVRSGGKTRTVEVWPIASRSEKPAPRRLRRFDGSRSAKLIGALFGYLGQTLDHPETERCQRHCELSLVPSTIEAALPMRLLLGVDRATLRWAIRAR
jgi:hypothetical protein